MRSPLKPLNTIVLRWSNGFQGPSIGTDVAERQQCPAQLSRQIAVLLPSLTRLDPTNEFILNEGILFAVPFNDVWRRNEPKLGNKVGEMNPNEEIKLQRILNIWKITSHFFILIVIVSTTYLLLF